MTDKDDKEKAATRAGIIGVSMAAGGLAGLVTGGGSARRYIS